jgi:malonyl-ACP decarboxylase
MNNDVVITGMGVITSIGQSIKEFTNALKQGKCGINYLSKKSVPETSVKIAAELSGFSFDSKILSYLSDSNKGIIKNALATGKRCTLPLQCSIISAIESWRSALLFEKKVDGERIGLIICGHNTTSHHQYGLYDKFVKDPEYLNPRYALQYMDTDQIGTLSCILGIHGEGFLAGGASASGNIGIIKGVQLIRSGEVDVCLVAGVLADLSPMELQGYYNIGAMVGGKYSDQPDLACRPFDKEHEGFVYGQAGGCLILESLASARKRGVPVLAKLLDGAIVLDGNNLSNPNEHGEKRAMELALKKSGISPSEVDYINAHGTSSPLGDKTELIAIKEVFKENTQKIWINSTKGLTGHCLYSAGLIEVIAIVIQLQEGFIHPNKNLQEPIDSSFRFSGVQMQQALIRTALNNSFGFGGINTCLVLKKE